MEKVQPKTTRIKGNEMIKTVAVVIHGWTASPPKFAFELPWFLGKVDELVSLTLPGHATAHKTEKEKADAIINKSHRMSRWESSIVTITSTARFGLIRECKLCGYEQAHTATGTHTHDELKEKCDGAE